MGFSGIPDGLFGLFAQPVTKRDVARQDGPQDYKESFVAIAEMFVSRALDGNHPIVLLCEHRRENLSPQPILKVIIA